MDASTFASLAGSLARAGLPALGTVLGAVLPPPWDLLAGGAFKLVANAMGVDPAAPDAPQQVQTAVDADPAGAVSKLQVIEQAHKDMADAANEELRLRLADVQDARATEVRYVQAGSQMQWGAPVVSTVVTVGFVGAICLMVLHPVTDSTGTVQMLMGVMASSFASVVGYYLGSSKGSSDKTDALVQLAKSPTVQAAPGAHVSASMIKGGR